MSIPVVGTKVSGDRKEEYLGCMLAAAFDYGGIPAGIGGNMDPSIQKAIQAGLGMFLGLTAGGMIWITNDSGKPNTLMEAIQLWLSGFPPYRMALFKAMTAAVISYLIVPDNKELQAIAVFALPIIKVKGEF